MTQEELQQLFELQQKAISAFPLGKCPQYVEAKKEGEAFLLQGVSYYNLNALIVNSSINEDGSLSETETVAY